MSDRTRPERKLIVAICLLSTLAYVAIVLVMAEFDVTTQLVLRLAVFAAAVCIAGWLVDRRTQKRPRDPTGAGSDGHLWRSDATAATKSRDVAPTPRPRATAHGSGRGWDLLEALVFVLAVLLIALGLLVDTERRWLMVGLGTFIVLAIVVPAALRRRREED